MTLTLQKAVWIKVPGLLSSCDSYLIWRVRLQLALSRAGNSYAHSLTEATHGIPLMPVLLYHEACATVIAAES
ncbi:hypothetical protein SERLA73DRAFT_124420 [Serpula lacrymans var. lacrymans S7.3]|uniref:Uncharacterized protein n=1 Tax=Serpula lacrymans var. lacrymans (strain S7.3) TaxID=936435 RepID=F8Q4V3_SERL3|nr:hypothetical protein SERLA73DRAFT_124420 [Serpula lacrymans var. lacrymans S7.3]